MSDPQSAPVRDRVLDTLRDEQPNVGLTAREISEATGAGYASVTETLRALLESGLVTKEKSGRQVTWTAVPVDVADEPIADVRRDASATGARVVDELPGEAGPVPVREDPAPSETAVDASDALVVPDPPTGPVSAVSVDAGTVATPVVPVTFTTEDLADAKSLSDVANLMESARPIPDAPAAPERRRRSAEPRAPRNDNIRNDFGNGGLQAAMLRWMDEQPRNEDGSYASYTPTQVAHALSAHASSVAYSFKQTTKKGQTVLASAAGEKPRFRLVTAHEAADAAGA